MNRPWVPDLFQTKDSGVQYRAEIIAVTASTCGMTTPQPTVNSLSHSRCLAIVLFQLSCDWMRYAKGGFNQPMVDGD